MEVNSFWMESGQLRVAFSCTDMVKKNASAEKKVVTEKSRCRGAPKHAFDRKLINIWYRLNSCSSVFQ